jgi:putative PIN family toxin of toxin-antitoxin system
MYKIVIDANVWIRFARAKDIDPLLQRMLLYSFVPVINNYLLSETFDAIVENKWMNDNHAFRLINVISSIAINKKGEAVYALSPDPKDNYLFDLAIQNNCVFIISDDSELLSFSIYNFFTSSPAFYLNP